MDVEYLLVGEGAVVSPATSSAVSFPHSARNGMVNVRSANVANDNSYPVGEQHRNQLFFYEVFFVCQPSCHD